MPAVRRVLRILLVCFLAAAMPLKGLAAVVVLTAGMAGGVEAAATAPAASSPPAGCHGHAARAADITGGGPTHPVHHSDAAPPAVQAAAHQAPHADPMSAPRHADASPLPVPHKCSACDACATAAPLPAQAPRIVAPEAGVARHPRLAQLPLCFITEGPDRPPRGPGA